MFNVQESDFRSAYNSTDYGISCILDVIVIFIIFIVISYLVHSVQNPVKVYKCLEVFFRCFIYDVRSK